jgi:alpha-beta hydrolase superfamily lysophospholipase
MPAPPTPPANRKKTIRAILGVLLCALGIALVLSMPREEIHTFRVAADGCHLVTDIVEPEGGESPQGYVVLLHGLAASKRVMSYMAAGFASQGLRVFVPDLPGHGRTDEPFSFERADECAENLVRELIGRGLLDPERTLLVGHSMGGAIALRVASRQPVAGAIAVSPAPMHNVPGLPPEAIPYHNFGKLPPHTLVLTGAGEPGILTQTAKDLVTSSGDPGSKYDAIPHVSHVSILFSAAAVAAEQAWADAVLHIERRPALPSHRGVVGLFLGLAGIITLAGPFLRELLQSKAAGPVATDQAALALSKKRLFLEIAGASLVAVGVLRIANPFRFLRLFEGDYFAGVLLLVGLIVLLLHAKAMRSALVRAGADPGGGRSRYVTILFAAFAALLLCTLFSAWFDLSFTEAWPAAPRLARFLPLWILSLPYHLAEELLLGPVTTSRKESSRLLVALSLRLVIWVVLVAAIFFLHSGQLLPVVLAPFFAAFCLGQRWGMDVVREVTGSPSAAAVFGAILLAGFCLVVFPTT